MTTSFPQPPAMTPVQATRPDAAAVTGVPRPAARSIPLWKPNPRGPNGEVTGARTGHASLIGHSGSCVDSSEPIVCGPATPSGAPPAQRWYRTRAALTCDSKTPVNSAEGKPCQARRNCSSATSQPESPTRSVRAPSSYFPQVPRAARAFRPATGLACIPALFCRPATACSVAGPSSPSTGPTYRPCRTRPTCRAATRALPMACARPAATSA